MFQPHFRVRLFFIQALANSTKMCYTYDTKASVNFTTQTSAYIYSKQCPRIKTSLEIACIHGQWYVRIPSSQETFIPSDEYIKFLSDNGIV